MWQYWLFPPRSMGVSLMHDLVLEVVNRLLLPFIQLFGMYILFHGHLSPGGGFSGGAVIGASLILYSLTFRFAKVKHRMDHDTSVFFEAAGALIYVGIGFVGLFFGYNYLTNRGVFPLGVPGQLWSSGMILVITLALGAKVSGTILSLFQELLEGGSDEHGTP